MGVVSAGTSARLVNRFGIKPPLAAGLLLAAGGLAALTGGYHAAFLADAASAALAALLALWVLRPAAAIPAGPATAAVTSDPDGREVVRRTTFQE